MNWIFADHPFDDSPALNMARRWPWCHVLWCMGEERRADFGTHMSHPTQAPFFTYHPQIIEWEGIAAQEPGFKEAHSVQSLLGDSALGRQEQWLRAFRIDGRFKGIVVSALSEFLTQVWTVESDQAAMWTCFANSLTNRLQQAFPTVRTPSPQGEQHCRGTEPSRSRTCRSIRQAQEGTRAPLPRPDTTEARCAPASIRERRGPRAGGGGRGRRDGCVVGMIIE